MDNVESSLLLTVMAWSKRDEDEGVIGDVTAVGLVERGVSMSVSNEDRDVSRPI